MQRAQTGKSCKECKENKKKCKEKNANLSIITQNAKMQK